jgi:hypothetical protein
MSGGDYDGDTFLVIWAEGVLGTIGDVAPPREEGGASTDVAGMVEKRPKTLIEYRLESRSSHTVGTAATLWRVYADKFGAKDR